MTRLAGRWARTGRYHLIMPELPPQFKSRPPSPGTVAPQGISTNHCLCIEIDPLVKLAVNLRSHRRHNVLVSLSYDWLQSDTHCVIQVQFHQMTSMERFGKLKKRKVWVSPYLIVDHRQIPDTHCSLRFAGPIPLNDADGTFRETKDEKSLG